MTAQTAFVFVIALVGIAFAALGMGEVLKARQSSHWPSVHGRITASKIIRRSGKQSVRPFIEYTYSAAGREFVGNRVEFGVPIINGPSSLAEPLVSRYPAGTDVVVYVNPINPSESVLEPGVRRRTFFLFAGGLSFAFLAGLIAVLGWLLQP